jgi:hypothetical protein
MVTIFFHKAWIGIVLVFLTLTVITVTTSAQASDDESTSSPAGGSPANNMAYQGYLEDGGQPANGLYDFRLSIWDQQTDGSQIGDEQVYESGITVADGLFVLYFYPYIPNQVFTGGERWIQIEVCPHGAGAFTTLPRQPITNVPYAWGLRPQAVISSSTAPSPAFGGAILNLENNTIPSIPKNNPMALYARSVSGTAVYATSESIGVYGYTNLTDAIGVVGMQTGYSTSDLGITYKPGGLFGGRNGVVGITKYHDGAAIVGLDQSSGSGWAGSFLSDNGNGVHISTEPGTTALGVVGGTKNTIVRTEEGSKLLYTEESTEVWFTDYGFSQLESGIAVIAVDPLFAKTVDMEGPYHVFVQVYGDAEVYVAARTPTGFEVHLRDGDPSVEFSYRIVAKRLGYEGARLEPALWADDDPNLYPERDIAGGSR